MASGLSGGGGGEVSQSHGVQRSAGQWEEQPDVWGGHAEGLPDGAGGAAVRVTPAVWGQSQGLSSTQTSEPKQNMLRK